MGVKEYSGLMVIDLDHLGTMLTKAKKKLSSDPHVFACFVSPSGNGLKAVYKVPSDIERHADAWATAAKRVKSLTGIDPDGSGKDIARLCFASHDASAYHNPNAVQLEIEPAPASGRRPQSEAGASIETKDVRREIAVELLGSVKWLNQWKGFCDCPGKAKHTNMNGDRDCQVNLDGAPTIYCFHGSCHDDVDRMNQQLRSRIGKEDSSRNESHERDEMVFERLKKLTPAEYDRCREKEAKQLGIE